MSTFAENLTGITIEMAGKLTKKYQNTPPGNKFITFDASVREKC